MDDLLKKFKLDLIEFQKEFNPCINLRTKNEMYLRDKVTRLYKEIIMFLNFHVKNCHAISDKDSFNNDDVPF